MKDKVFRVFTMLLTGSVIYFNFEIFVRGYSHISMFILWGICFFLVGMIGNYVLGIKILFAIKPNVKNFFYQIYYYNFVIVQINILFNDNFKNIENRY